LEGKFVTKTDNLRKRAKNMMICDDRIYYANSMQMSKLLTLWLIKERRLYPSQRFFICDPKDPSFAIFPQMTEFERNASLANFVTL
jgi:hypothetical protein